MLYNIFNVMTQAEKEFAEETKEADKEDGSKREEKEKGKRKIDETEGDDENEEMNRNAKKKQKFYTILRERATIKHLFEAMQGLSVERRKVIRQMGFGDLIEFTINEVPKRLAFFVVDSLDVETMNLRLPTGNLQLSPQTVNVVLGLPNGSRRLERNEGKREKQDRFKQEWMDQFIDENKLTINAISKQIKNTRNSDFMFKMNFLMLVANTLGECDTYNVVKTTVLENILEEDDVAEIDWCRYVYECAMSSKKDWAKRKKDRTEVVYYGPVTFLVVSAK